VELFVDAVSGRNEKVVVALIVDSPWIPGFVVCLTLTIICFLTAGWKPILKCIPLILILFPARFLVEYGWLLNHLLLAARLPGQK